MSDDRLIREPERRAITGLSYSTWHRLEERGAAPKPVKLGARAVAWKLSDLQAWVQRIEAEGVPTTTLSVPIERADEYLRSLPERISGADIRAFTRPAGIASRNSDLLELEGFPAPIERQGRKLWFDRDAVLTWWRSRWRAA